MECPICGSDDFDVINSKQKSSKKKIMEEYLLKCVALRNAFVKNGSIFKVLVMKCLTQD